MELKLRGLKYRNFETLPVMQADKKQLKQFGENLRRLRKEKNLSQEQLAFDAQLDRSFVGQVERGERNLSLLSILRLADALKIPPEKLFSGDSQ